MDEPEPTATVTVNVFATDQADKVEIRVDSRDLDPHETLHLLQSAVKLVEWNLGTE